MCCQFYPLFRFDPVSAVTAIKVLSTTVFAFFFFFFFFALGGMQVACLSCVINTNTYLNTLQRIFPEIAFLIKYLKQSYVLQSTVA